VKLSAIRVDAARADQGAWVTDIPDMGDLRLKVRGHRNVDARRLRSKLVAAVPRAERDNGRLTPDAADRIDAQIMAETILVDWGNVTGDDDQPLPYSPEKAKELLSNPDFALFKDAVAYASSLVSEGAAEQTEADRGN
jgi:hypothetical protein